MAKRLPEEFENFGTHITHCCALHGCKYGDGKNCPVETQEYEQKYLCETCCRIIEDAKDYIKEIEAVQTLNQKIHSHHRT